MLHGEKTTARHVLALETHGMPDRRFCPLSDNSADVATQEVRGIPVEGPFELPCTLVEHLPDFFVEAPAACMTAFMP